MRSFSGCPCGFTILARCWSTLSWLIFLPKLLHKKIVQTRLLHTKIVQTRLINICSTWNCQFSQTFQRIHKLHQQHLIVISAYLYSSVKTISSSNYRSYSWMEIPGIFCPQGLTFCSCEGRNVIHIFSVFSDLFNCFIAECVACIYVYLLVILKCKRNVFIFALLGGIVQKTLFSPFLC